MLTLIVGVVLAAVVFTEHPASGSAARRHAPFHDLSTLPLTAQGVVSGTVAADSAVYRVRRSGAGFKAQSAAQGLHLGFDRSGVHVTSGSTQLGLGLQAWGYGNSLQTVRPVRPSGSANRVTYNRSGLSEWYRNGPLGLEQGFTVYRAPASPASRPLTLSIPLAGNAHASLASDRQSLTLTRTGHSSLRYAGLVATDARARALRSWLELHGGRMLLRVDTRGARYPVRIDPLLQQAKLAGGEEINDARYGAKFGFSVALSSDGNTALIGGHEDKGGRGAAWVFTRLGATWSQQGPKLTGKEELTGGRFGAAAALSSDGNTALIGGPGDASTHGAFWIFTRSGSTWTQQGPKLTAQGELGTAFVGIAVALSGDGNTALVSGPGYNGALGAAWVFTREGTTWSQQAKLTGNEEIGRGAFGRWGVVLSTDGNTALVGGPGDNAWVGAAWVFTRAGRTWTQQAKLTGKEEIGAGRFGYGGALSSDGNTALIGGPKDNGRLGAAWVFTRAGTTWTQQAKLTGTEEITSEGVDLGKSVALSSDGDTALVGGATDNDRVGAAWLFTRTGATWSQQAKLTGDEEIGDAQFGRAIALSSNGSTVLIGGPHDNANVGAAWVFAIPSPTPTVISVNPNNGPESGGTTATITGTNLGAVTAVRFGSANATSFTVDSSTEITASSPAASGTVDVTVSTPSDASATGPGDQFTYVAAPTVTAVSPTSGPGWGGTSVTITGTNLSGASAVTFGSTNATSFTVNASNSITATSPVGTGVVDVSVTSVGGTSATSASDQFSYRPSVTGVSPSGGPTAGGTSVTITGSNFNEVTGVKFGSTEATGFTVNSATSITATAPAAAGTVDVIVTTSGGTSPTTSADQFTYVAEAAPSIAAVGPIKGRAAGGTTVTITGTNFTGATAVKFGAVNAAGFEISSSTSIKAVSPPETAGRIDITVVTPNGESAISSADHYTFGPPTITKLSPNGGPPAGGTSVTVTGTGFAPGTGATAFKFGQTASTSVTCSSITTCTVSSPSHVAGTVDVEATVSGLNSAKAPADRFTYS